MINDKHDLVATFTNGLGKEHNWTYKDVNPDLPAPAIKEACELLTNLDIFEQNGVKLFDSIVTAKIVTTKETEIFDVKNDPKNEENQPKKELQSKNEEAKIAKEGFPAEPKIGPYLLTKNVPQIGELSTEKCKMNSARFPSVSLPASKVSTRLPQTSSGYSNSVNTEIAKSPTANKDTQTSVQTSERNNVGLKERFARLWGKKGKNKEDPS